MIQTEPGQQSSARLEVLSGMQDFVRRNVDELLKPVSQSWQPADFLPELSSPNWREDIHNFKETSKCISDELLVVLIGDTVTEEALPSYQTWINGLHGIKDETGNSDSPWACWSRGWTAEENRHGDLLNRYLYLTGRVNMKSVETTIQHLIRNGFNPETENDPYLGFVYTSFQERATKISHRNVSILAARAGETRLQNICGLIAGDEARHEKAYTLFMQRIFELDPAGAVLAFAKMMKKKIVMPAKLMGEGADESLFNSFSLVAQRIGVYTALDYASIIEHLVSAWNVPSLQGLSGAAAEAQDYVCSLAPRYKRLAQRITLPNAPLKFNWIHATQA